MVYPFQTPPGGQTPWISSVCQTPNRGDFCSQCYEPAPIGTSPGASEARPPVGKFERFFSTYFWWLIFAVALVAGYALSR